MTETNETKGLDALAKALHWKMDRLDSNGGPEWEALSEREREFYRLCVEHVVRQPEAASLILDDPTITK